MSALFSRRHLLQGGGLLAATAALTTLPVGAAAQEVSRPAASRPLQFNSDGKFRIVQFNDTQDGPLTDRRTIEFMGKVLDEVEPDFALINGDVINGDPTTAEEVYQAINNVVLPMETRSIPWAVTFGNHDEDSAESNGTGVREPQMVEFVRQYAHNHNPADDGLYGHSNAQILVNDSAGNPGQFAIWLLDSGRYAPVSPAGQSTDGLKAYDWIRPEQIRWYTDTSLATELDLGHKVPGLMFFHIPTFEHHHMWYGQQFTSSALKQREAARRHGIVGEKNEDCYTGLFNSGIYAAAFERGDILGMYCGHDHINTYMGNYYGIELGYGPGTGFAPYGIGDGTWRMHTLRGARVFELDENSERVYDSTRVIFAKDLDVDMNPKPRPLEAPADFPAGVSPVPADAGAGDAGEDTGADADPAPADPGSSLSSGFDGSSWGSSR